MTPRERFLATLDGTGPDQVPCSPLFHYRYAHVRLGRSDWQAVFELHGQLGTVHFRGPIGLGISATMPAGYSRRSEVVRREGTRVETRHWITTPRGELTSLDVQGMIPQDPMTSKTVEYFVKDRED